MRLINIALLILSLIGCASSPTSRFESFSEKLELNKAVYQTDDFEHFVFSKDFKHTSHLHIYIGGDGSPWSTPTLINIDPTSAKAVLLNLMSLDTYPSLFVGRPCYHSYGKGKNCSNRWWTSHRYSAKVVTSMKQVIRQLIDKHRTPSLSLIGFSGGGTLAMLLAHDIPQVKHVVTINGNLDIDYWTNKHGYSPLVGSINPADLPALPESILKIHLLGADDKIIDAQHIKSTFADRKNTEVIIYPKFTHHCCWADVWEAIAKRLN